MLALHLPQSALVHVDTPLVQQILAEPAWAKKLTEEDRRGLTALFWSNVNPYGTFRLDMDKCLDLGSSVMVPGQWRAAAHNRMRSRSAIDP
ncbi:Tn3 family transposase [Streptomyces sp. TN58]|uniref:Tn3 family transposase n=1 Tax=Streptomyces sp. TN58 TaxID=234612 RepID=UPI000B050890|nr:Tn3 family transposase [Streptomyces sp. TN58]